MTVGSSTATRRWQTLDEESLALLLAAFSFGVTMLVAMFVFWGRELSINGRGSIGDFTAIAGAVAAAVAFAAARLRHRGDDGVGRYRWFDLVALSLAHGAIALLAWIGIATVLNSAFQDATVFASPAVVLAGAGAAVSSYLSYLSGSNLSPRQLSVVLAVFLVFGMLAAMLSANDPHWWEMNLSALGMSRGVSALAFNLTLIVSGVIVTTIARLGTATLPADSPGERRRRTTVRVVFVLLGVLLALVGVFPVDQFLLIHNVVATGMTVVFAVLVIGLPWLVPTMPRAFVVLGYVYVIAVVGLGVLFAFGIYNLTAVELIASLLIFSWIILFLRFVAPRSKTGAQADV